jgi:mannosyl-3-phosphoglycerate phosphatase
MPLLIFTDLDGSLMEHETYSVAPAQAALAEIRQRSIPLILNSSKTAAEIQAIQAMHGFSAPFICENGAALYETPDAPPKSFGDPLLQWLPMVHRLRENKHYKFSGFSDWSPSEIAALTGLSLEQASQAKQRQYSEPILWRDSENDKAEFLDSLSSLDLQLLEGGRFLSIQSHFNKSDAMNWLTQKLNSSASPLTTVALGDSPNDAAMLNSADIAVIIKSAKSDQIRCPNAGMVITTSKPGPSGWNDAILKILSLHDKNPSIQLKQ